MQSNLDVDDLPIVARAREVGVRAAMLEAVNDTVRRATAALDIAALRGLLRGDPPERPYPRSIPHPGGFWLHLLPPYYHEAVTGLYPTFRLGWLSTFFFVLEAITGIFLLVFYTPSTTQAYDNMLNILSNVPLGQFMRDLHRLGAEA